MELDTTFTTAYGHEMSFEDYLRVTDQRLANIEQAVAGMSHELFGPRGPKGEIAGWNTTNGPRTVVAMLVDLLNGMYAPIHSAVAGSDVTFSPRQAWANADGYGFTAGQKLNGLWAAFDELADAVASERDLDAEVIKNAVRDALDESAVQVDVAVSGAVPENTVATERAQRDTTR